MLCSRKSFVLVQFVVVACLVTFLPAATAHTSPEPGDDPFPTGQAVARAEAGDLILKAGTYRVGEKGYRADYGILAVPEDRTNPDSQLIHLPLIRIYATAEAATEPVFRLSGGPGSPNAWTDESWSLMGLSEHPEAFLLDHHDLVMVGYRGVDGDVSLNCPEVAQALTVESNPLSPENLEKLGEAWQVCFERLAREGVDVDRYTMVDVVDDLETARKALGYGKINIFSGSYGTRVAYLYGLRYPESVHRSFMFGVNPPGRFVFEPDMVDAQISYLADLWQQDPEAVARTPDIVETIHNVLDSLPKRVGNVLVDADKVRLMMNLTDGLREPQEIAMLFDAFVAAEGGDYRGLAYLTFCYDLTVPPVLSNGDYPSKFISADYDPGRDYEAEMDLPGAIIGSPVSELLFGPMKYGGWPIESIPEEYRSARYSDVETLMVNGVFDMAASSTTNELLPYLPNGQHLLLKELGHCRGVQFSQPHAFQHLVETFYLEGIVDDSLFTYQPMSFTPVVTYQDMYEQLVSRAGD